MSMEITEAKAFYKTYMGEQFHMGREEWSRYRMFQALDIDDEQLAAWDEELFHEQLALLSEPPEQIWFRHENLLKILLRGRCEANHYGELLLAEMEKMTTPDEMNLILIIENMAGRDREWKQGGVYFFCTKTKLAARLKICMEQILASAPENPVSKDRLESAVESYRKALARYGG